MKAFLRRMSTLVMDVKAVDGKPVLTLSLGRISFITVLIISIVFWAQGNDIPENLKTSLLALAGYNFGTKGVQAIAARFGG